MSYKASYYKKSNKQYFYLFYINTIVRDNCNANKKKSCKRISNLLLNYHTFYNRPSFGLYFYEIQSIIQLR